MPKETRSEIIRSRITPSMRQQVELDLAKKSNVLSISDYLFELIEKRITEIEIEQQKIGRRIGNQ